MFRLLKLNNFILVAEITFYVSIVQVFILYLLPRHFLDFVKYLRWSFLQKWLTTEISSTVLSVKTKDLP